MTVKTLLLGVVAGSMCLSCGSDAEQGADDRLRRDQMELRRPEAPIAPPGGAAAAASSPAAASIENPRADSADESEMMLAPKDAQWTIYCATLAGDDHIAMAKALRKSLVERTGMRDWNVVTESGQSRLYYGFYRAIDDPDAKRDRRKIDEMVDGAGERPFKACHFVQLNAPDPESPPEWNLVNAPPDKVWTLIIAAYKDHPDRKRAAVESVRDARARGEEAYYYHGESISNVCIGAWPDEAVLEERVDAKEGVRAQDPLLVLPPGMKVPGKVRRDGKAVRAVGQQLVPVDEGLKRKIEQYPQMGVNGDVLIIRRNNRERVQGPLLTMIPRPAEDLFGANTAEEDAAPADFNRGQDPFGPAPAARSRDSASPSQLPPASPGSPGSPRRLRGIGDK